MAFPDQAVPIVRLLLCICTHLTNFFVCICTVQQPDEVITEEEHRGFLLARPRGRRDNVVAGKAQDPENAVRERERENCCIEMSC